ncbi:MAG TPA: XRE family transcriptional regulator [Cyanobacteria bacterium UBA8553]|nr:XRE family transcriptional regulator [Cyanobacteria bacterium UBA8553]HAJ61754.1 XRE family transcriptional regulator [Cyanobacteria bacterium UBA8543]
MATPLEIFGNTVRTLRIQKGLSQESLADLCNLHRTYIGGIERGERNIALMNILYIAKALDVLPIELLRDFDSLTITNLPKK